MELAIIGVIGWVVLIIYVVCTTDETEGELDYHRKNKETDHEL